MTQLLRWAFRSCFKEEAPSGEGAGAWSDDSSVEEGRSQSSLDRQPRANERIAVRFPAGTMGFDICEKDGKFIVASSSGVAKEQGVGINDVVVQIGTVVLADELKDVEDDQRFHEVMRMLGSFPRPLTIVFAKPSVWQRRGRGGRAEG